MPMIQSQPYNEGTAITKSDTVNIYGVTETMIAAGSKPILTDAVYVGGAGVVVAVFSDGTTQSFTAVAGEILPIAIKRVNSTNTTATLMIALRCI